MTKDQESQGFTVKDKRMFREDGAAKDDAGDTEPRKNSGSDPVKVVEEPAPGNEPPPGTGGKIDFPSYILSYYTQGLVLLGEVPNPYTNKKEEDLESARHIVDLLGLLQEKTKGNLSNEESQLLESVLYELRMKFMAKTNKIKL
jgi:hypothetical protein